jgi:hypothetical protein
MQLEPHSSRLTVVRKHLPTQVDTVFTRHGGSGTHSK